MHNTPLTEGRENSYPFLPAKTGWEYTGQKFEYDEEFFKWAIPDLVAKLESDVTNKQTPEGPTWMWITVNPEPKVDPNTFVDEINDFITQHKYIREGNLRYIYAFEQRCETIVELESKDSPGIHVHILIQSPTEKRQVDNFITLLRKRLTKYCMIGDSKHVYAKTIPNSLFLQKLRYMTGHKSDEKKQKKIEVDQYYFNKIKVQNLVFNFNYKDEI